METSAAGCPIAAIICAAGNSSRMGKGKLKKEYRPLPGSNLTVLGQAVSAFAAIPQVKIIVIAVPDDPETGEAAARKILPQELFSENSDCEICFITGGLTRRASVLNALSLLSEKSAGEPPRFVLIHDGARPWVSESLILRTINALGNYPAVIPLLPLAETPKETDLPLDSNSPVFIKKHLKRVLTGTAQTPQGFAFPEIFVAHKKAALPENLLSGEYTDDAEIWAAFFGSVAVIPGEAENRKITFAEDIPC